MSNVSVIGRYQLENLLANRVRFTFLDLRSPENLGQTPPHLATLLAGALPVAADKILDHLNAAGIGSGDPIVLICENGSKSMAAAQQLEKHSYINVFVVEGGLASL